MQSPDAPGFSSALPFKIAAGLGFLGTALLLVWQWSSRRTEPAKTSE
jgi:hypothetical protein